MIVQFDQGLLFGTVAEILFHVQRENWTAFTGQLLRRLEYQVLKGNTPSRG